MILKDNIPEKFRILSIFIGSDSDKMYQIAGNSVVTGVMANSFPILPSGKRDFGNLVEIHKRELSELLGVDANNLEHSQLYDETDLIKFVYKLKLEN